MDSVGPLLGEWRAVCLRETSKGKWPSEPSEGNEVPASFLLGGCLQATEWECFRSDSIKIKTDYGYHLGSTSWNCTVLRVFSLFSAQSPASRHKSHCSQLSTQLWKLSSYLGAHWRFFLFYKELKSRIVSLYALPVVVVVVFLKVPFHFKGLHLVDQIKDSWSGGRIPVTGPKLQRKPSPQSMSQLSHLWC